MEDTLKKQVAEYRLEKEVIFLGFVDDVDTFMNSIDIFVFSSISEGFGFSIVEAMLRSKPVVAFNITSTPEIVVNNESGFLVGYPDMESYANKIIELSVNKKLRMDMGKKGLIIIQKRFDLKDKIIEIESFLNENV